MNQVKPMWSSSLTTELRNLKLWQRILLAPEIFCRRISIELLWGWMVSAYSMLEPENLTRCGFPQLSLYFTVRGCGSNYQDSRALNRQTTLRKNSMTTSLCWSNNIFPGLRNRKFWRRFRLRFRHFIWTRFRFRFQLRFRVIYVHTYTFTNTYTYSICAHIRKRIRIGGHR